MGKPATSKKNGTFTVIKEDEFINCIGITPELRHGYPLLMEGEYNAQGCFEVQKMSFDACNEAAFIKYMSGNSFKGVGIKQATKLYKLIKDINVETCTYEDIDKILTKLVNVSETTRYAINIDIRGLAIRARLEQDLMPYGAKCSDIETLFQKYHDDALEKIRDNPYIMLNQGVSFKLCDNIAYEKKEPKDGVPRINAILHELRAHMFSTGSTCLTIQDARSILDYIQKGSCYGTLPDIYLISRVIGSRQFIVKEYDKDIRIYTKGSAYIEEHIASEIQRLQVSGFSTGYHHKKENCVGLDEDQAAALSLLETGGVKIITGGPGSGKTTLIKKYIEEYKKLDSNNVFYLCAPTGRAAVRIQESSSYPAQTIHKLLGYKPYSLSTSEEQGDETVSYDKNNQFPVALFIIDEMSMVGESLFLKFLEAVPNGSTVILSGDPNQLKSVEPGNVLEDLIRSENVPVSRLTHIHRQGAGSSIVTNYYNIKDKTTSLVYDDNFQVMHSGDPAYISQWINTIREAYEDPDDPYSFQIITFVKNGEFGKDTLNNRFIQQKLSYMNEEQHKEYYYGRSNYSIGDKIMMTANNYHKGYWNGDIGIIKSVNESGMTAEFYDGIRTIDKESVQDMDHAWAATTHKSQGSEYKTVLVIADSAYPGMLYNSIILTAVTRAREKVFIISVDDAFEKSIRNDEPAIRTTWLDKIMSKDVLAELCGNKYMVTAQV